MVFVTKSQTITGACMMEVTAVKKKGMKNIVKTARAEHMVGLIIIIPLRGSMREFL